MNNEKTKRKKLENVRRRRSKPIEKENRDKIICEQVASGSKGTREFQNKEQTARKLPGNFENKEQAKRKRLENLRTRANRSQRTRDFEKKPNHEQKLENSRTGGQPKPLETD